MGYVLNAVVAEAAVFTPPPDWLSEAEIVTLNHGFQMAPITEAISNRLSSSALTSGAVLRGFYFLTQSLWERCQTLSERGVVAYIEDECFGGPCDQHCVVWRNGEVILGPLDADYAVNKALHQIGVPHTILKDEFDTLSLGRYRETEEWLSQE